jgi:hypothetical protein
LDFCKECKEKIVNDIRKFAGQEQEFIELGPDPETDDIFEELVVNEFKTEERTEEREEDNDRNIKWYTGKKEEQLEKTETERKRYAKMSIRDLLKEGVSIDDIVKVRGCCRQSVLNVRSSMKKRGEKIPDHRTTIEEKDRAAVQASNSAAVKTYNCTEVIDTCVYSTRMSGMLCCDYLDKHGKSRGCKPSACTVYVRKGEK